MSEAKKSKWALFLEGFKEGWQEETAGQQKRVSTEGVEAEDDFYLPFEDEEDTEKNNNIFIPGFSAGFDSSRHMPYSKPDYLD